MDLAAAMKRITELETEQSTSKSKIKELEKTVDTERANKEDIKLSRDAYKSSHKELEERKKVEAKEKETKIKETFGDKSKEAKEFMDKGLDESQIKKLLDIEDVKDINEETESKLGGGINPNIKTKNETKEYNPLKQGDTYT